MFTNGLKSSGSRIKSKEEEKFYTRVAPRIRRISFIWYISCGLELSFELFDCAYFVYLLHDR